MIKFVKKYVAHETLDWQTLLLLGIILLIPFSIRYVIDSPLSFKTGAYSDFTSISLYLSDFLVLSLIIYLFYKYRDRMFSTWYAFLIFWLILELFIASKQYMSLQSYFSLRLAALFIFSLLIAHTTWKKDIIAWLIVILGAFQAIIAAFQFFLQKSLGLYLLGESHLSPSTSGVAKIVAHGTTLIRGYGTFPHSNLLAAFLVVSFAMNLYLITKTYQKRTLIILSACLVMNIFGLFVSFSRAGIAAGAGIGIIFALVLIIRKQWPTLKKIVLPALVGLTLVAGLLWPYLTTRVTISDNAVKERVFYNKIGLKIIKANLLLGVGPGTSVLHMEQFSDEQLQPWEIQPIHNYYLITIAEWGIAGFILLLVIGVPIISLVWRTLKNLDDYWRITLSLLGLAILFLFLFDHYFYTIWPTQLLLWLIIGLILRENLTKKPS